MRIQEVNLSIPHYVAASLYQRAQDGMPHEVCGTIDFNNCIHGYENITQSDPCHSFDMDLKREDALKTKIIWHSHPNGPEYPSGDDIPAIRQMTMSGWHFGWIVISPGGVFEYAVYDVDINTASDANIE